MGRRERQWTPLPSPSSQPKRRRPRGKEEEEERTKKLEDLGQYVMLMAEAHGLLILGKPAWTAGQRARFRVLTLLRPRREEEEEEEGEEEASSNFLFRSRCSQSEIWCFLYRPLVPDSPSS